MQVINTLLGFATQLTLLIVKTTLEILLKLLFGLGQALGSLIGSWASNRRPRWKNHQTRKRRRSPRRRH